MTFSEIILSWINGNKADVFEALRKIEDKAEFVIFLRNTTIEAKVKFELYEWFFWMTGKHEMEAKRND